MNDDQNNNVTPAEDAQPDHSTVSSDNQDAANKPISDEDTLEQKRKKRPKISWI